MFDRLEGDTWRLEELPNGNWEFSLVRFQIGGRSIIPTTIRDQGDELTCVFEATLTAAEIEALRMQAEHEASTSQPSTSTAAANSPSTSTITFRSGGRGGYVDIYEEHIGMSLEEEGRQRMRRRDAYRRPETAFMLFEKDGVPATSEDWGGERIVKLRSYRTLRQLQLSRIANYILKGRCLVGAIPAGEYMRPIGPNEIYEFHQEEAEANGVETIDGHMVVFIGYGFEASRDGRAYLVFVNSGGPEFGENGVGRVYLDQVYREKLYLLNVAAPIRPPVGQDNAGASSSQAASLASPAIATNVNNWVTADADVPDTFALDDPAINAAVAAALEATDWNNWAMDDAEFHTLLQGDPGDAPETFGPNDLVLDAAAAAALEATDSNNWLMDESDVIDSFAPGDLLPDTAAALEADLLEVLEDRTPHEGPGSSGAAGGEAAVNSRDEEPEDATLRATIGDNSGVDPDSSSP